MAIEEKIIVRRLEAGADYGWAVILIDGTGRKAGQERCLALLCGGNLGKILAAQAAKQIAIMKLIDTIEIEPDLATTKD